MPEGYTEAKQPPSEAELEFGNEAGDGLVGRHILFNWAGVGWCEGVIDKRNTLKGQKIGKDFVNFWVHYEIDDNTSKHNLELNMYGGGVDEAEDHWVLLDKLPEGDKDAEAPAADEGAAE